MQGPQLENNIYYFVKKMIYVPLQFSVLPAATFSLRLMSYMHCFLTFFIKKYIFALSVFFIKF